MAEWALFISISALVLSIMALPTALQMFYGRPNILTSYGVIPVNGQLHLVCTLQNLPIKNKFLKALGIRRETAESVRANYTIADETGKIIADNVIAAIRHIFEGDFKGRVNLKLEASIPASDIYTDFALAYYAGGMVGLVGDDYHQNIVLPIGKYSATIKIKIAEKEIEKTKRFVVEEKGFGWRE
jgi:hypothetical protein